MPEVQPQTQQPEPEIKQIQDEPQPEQQPEEAPSEPLQANEAPPQFPMGSQRPPFRPHKFPPRNWNNNGMPRWPPGQFSGQRPPHRGPPMMGPNPQGRLPGPQMRPGGPFPPQRPPFFMPPGGARPPQQRFFFQNQPGRPPAPPSYVPTPIQSGPAPMGVNAMPRKVLINPNFKGGVEAVKSEFENLKFIEFFLNSSFLAQLMKDHFSQSVSSEEELLRKQEEFINRNMRSIEKRKYERSPSPVDNYRSDYRRSYSHSPSPPRYRRRPFNRGGGGNYGERRRSFGDKTDKKDENDPNEDEETRAYRKEIEKQRKQREEIFKQKELRRKQLLEAKAKEKEPVEPLTPIVVTEKKIILNKKPRLDERSTTPPLSEKKPTTARRIVLKPAKEISQESLRIGIAGAEKKKLQNMIQAEN